MVTAHDAVCWQASARPACQSSDCRQARSWLSIVLPKCRVDNEGDYVLENTNTGARASLYFTPCGWFSSGRYEVCGKAHSWLGQTALGGGTTTVCVVALPDTS